MKRQKISVRTLGLESLESRCLLAADLFITEFLTDNGSGIRDSFGERSDWIEIFNAGDMSANLSDYALTDNAVELDKWQFPSGSLGPGESIVVFASGRDVVVSGEYHTNFSLNKSGEYLGLHRLSDFSSNYIYAPTYPEQFEDVSYGLEMEIVGPASTILTTGQNANVFVPPNGDLGTTWTEEAFDDSAWPISGPTPVGYDSPSGDYAGIIDTTIPSGSQGAYIRIPFTLTAADISTLTLRMRYDDGFVAYINGVQVAVGNAPDTPNWNSLASGNHDDQDAVVFEDYDASAGVAALKAGQNVLAIHGMNVSTTSSDFLMDAELVGQSGQIVMPYREGYLNDSTPSSANGESFNGFVDDVTFDVPHGLYDSQFSLSMATTTPGSFIAYTTDGSDPVVVGNTVTNGLPYTSPITVDATTVVKATAHRIGYVPSDPFVSTYIFLEDVLDQSPNGEVPAGFAPDGTNGKDLNYGMDPQIINAFGRQAVKDALSEIPTFSIVTDTENLFDPATGIYVNAQNGGRSWERATSVELINPDGSTGFQVNAGLRIRGGFSRNDFNPKNAFRFYFREEYGASKLEYPVFGDEGVDEFDVLDLRTAQNYSWSSSGSTENTFLREIWGRDAQRDLGHEYTRSNYNHLYINGVYWGLYQTQERVEDFYAESYFGGDKDDYDVVKSGIRDTGGPTEIKEGNDEAWFDLWQLTQTLWENPSANADNYFTIQGLHPDGTRDPSLEVLLDVDQLIDYMILLFHTGSRDSGLSDFIGNNVGNNWFGLRNRVSGDEGFVFFVHDNEHSMGADNTDNVDRTGPYNTSNQNNFQFSNPQYMHQDLLASSEYRLRFADRVNRHFFNDGELTLQNNVDRLNERVDQVSPVILAESARWGDSKVSTPRTPVTWQNEINSILNGFFPNRNNLVLNQLAGDNLWPSLQAATFNQHGGTVPANTPAISLWAPNGTVFFTTDGSDPRLPGGAVNPAAMPYSSFISLSEDATVKARVLSGSAWSALTEADFILQAQPADSSNLRITELHYHPLPPTAAELAAAPNTTGGDYEFIEVTNTGNSAIDLTSVQLGGGVIYTNGPASLATGQSAVIVSDITAFQARYGTGITIVGEYGPSSGLANGGEALTLSAANGSLIHSFAYDDNDDWPSLSDGFGESLQVIDVNGNYGDPLNWLPSREVHGTPGIQDAPVASNSSLRITEVNYNPQFGGAEFVELMNVGSSTIDVSGFRLVEGVEFEFPAGGSSQIAPGQRVVIAGSTAAFTATYGAGIPLVGQFSQGSLANGGERIILFDDQGHAVHDFVYDDVAPWPTSPDGNGNTLVIIDVDGDYSSASNWQPSDVIGGTPGAGSGVDGDFDQDGNLTCSDINALTAESANGTHQPSFDVNSDGLVNVNDVNFWILSLKGTLLGDANLDFVVDASDFNVWNSNKFTLNAAWCSGDFNADGSVDASDFNVWNANKFTDALPVIAPGLLPNANAADQFGQSSAMTFAEPTEELEPQTLPSSPTEVATFERYALHHTTVVSQASSSPRDLLAELFNTDEDWWR